MLARSLPAGLSVVLLLPALLRADDAPKIQDKDLEGDWSAVSAMRGGENFPPPEGKMVFTFKGDALTQQSNAGAFTSKFAADPSKMPKTIDITTNEGPLKDKAILAIYEIKGDELRICMAYPGKKDRPTEFAAKPGTDWTLAMYKRVKK